MLKTFFVVAIGLAEASGCALAQAVVHVDTTHLDGPRTLNAETRTAAIRDYLQSWQTLSNALGQNRADLLDGEFVGTARDKIVRTIQEQTELDISTRYQDRSHNIQVTFYSPDGLSIELLDTAEYDVQVTDHGKMVIDEPDHSRYIVVLTPSEVHWRVRVFQAAPN